MKLHYYLIKFYFFVKWCLRQETGTNLCAFYVCEYIRSFVSERDREQRTRDVCIHSSHFLLPCILC